MTPYFDRQWFDIRLTAAGLERAVAATALSVSELELEEIWAAQRFLFPHEARQLGILLNVRVEEILTHAHVPLHAAPFDQLATDLRLVREHTHDAHHRLTRLEKAALNLKTHLVRLGRRKS